MKHNTIFNVNVHIVCRMETPLIALARTNSAMSSHAVQQAARVCPPLVATELMRYTVARPVSYLMAGQSRDKVIRAQLELCRPVDNFHVLQQYSRI